MASLRTFWRDFTYSKFVEDDRKDVVKERKSVKDIFTDILGPFESYVVYAQSILIWEKPWASALTLLLFNALFWLVVNCQSGFYCSLGTGAGLIFVSRTWVNQIWPEIRVPIPEGEDTEEWTPVNPQVLSVPEISHYLQEMLKTSKEWGFWLIDLRHDQPGKFCLLLTCILTSTAVIGHYISGVLISYILMMAVLVGPGFLVHIYPRILSLFASEPILLTLDSHHAPLNEFDEMDEYLPEPNHATMAALSCALDSQETDCEESLMIASKELGLEDYVSNEGEDFTPQTSLVDLPSHDKDSEDDEEYIGHLDDRFEAPQAVSRPIPVGPFMSFASQYFNGDSDDSEEEKLAMGLDFPSVNESSNDGQVVREGVASLTVSMPPLVHPAAPLDDDHAMAKSMISPAQPLTNPNFSGKVPIGSDNISDMSSSGNNGLSETAGLFSRQLSTHSDEDFSDFEIVSESELS